MTRTRLAALQAAGAAFLLVAGTGAVAGFGLLPSVLTGLVLGALGGGLLLAAAARAGTATDDPPRAPAPDTDPTDSTSEDTDRG